MKKRKRKTKFLAVLLILLVLTVAFVTGVRQLFPLDYEAEIHAASAEYGLPYWTVVAVIKAESNFDKNACSHKNAKGLMQLTDKTAAWFAEREQLGTVALDDPAYNINIGCAYLAYLRDEFGGDLDVALAAYNAGEGNVREWLENPDYSTDGKTLTVIPFPETDSYLKKIKKYQKIYLHVYG